MTTYIRTVSFRTGSNFDSKKDDAVVNAALQELQAQGATIQNIELRLAAGSNYTHATYLIVFTVP
jgi:hypothetical protein